MKCTNHESSHKPSVPITSHLLDPSIKQEQILSALFGKI